MCNLGESPAGRPREARADAEKVAELSHVQADEISRIEDDKHKSQASMLLKIARPGAASAERTQNHVTARIVFSTE